MCARPLVNLSAITAVTSGTFPKDDASTTRSSVRKWSLASMSLRFRTGYGPTTSTTLADLPRKVTRISDSVPVVRR